MYIIMYVPMYIYIKYLLHRYVLVVLKIKDLKTTNRDCKKVTKQGSKIQFSWHLIT